VEESTNLLDADAGFDTCPACRGVGGLANLLVDADESWCWNRLDIAASVVCL
jgi:hypothetical protein